MAVRSLEDLDPRGLSLLQNAPVQSPGGRRCAGAHTGTPGGSHGHRQVGTQRARMPPYGGGAPQGQGQQDPRHQGMRRAPRRPECLRHTPGQPKISRRGTPPPPDCTPPRRLLPLPGVGDPRTAVRRRAEAGRWGWVGRRSAGGGSLTASSSVLRLSCEIRWRR